MQWIFLIIVVFVGKTWLEIRGMCVEGIFHLHQRKLIKAFARFLEEGARNETIDARTGTLEHLLVDIFELSMWT